MQEGSWLTQWSSITETWIILISHLTSHYQIKTTPSTTRPAQSKNRISPSLRGTVKPGLLLQGSPLVSLRWSQDGPGRPRSGSSWQICFHNWLPKYKLESFSLINWKLKKCSLLQIKFCCTNIVFQLCVGDFMQNFRTLGWKKVRNILMLNHD